MGKIEKPAGLFTARWEVILQLRLLMEYVRHLDVKLDIIQGDIDDLGIPPIESARFLTWSGL